MLDRLPPELLLFIIEATLPPDHVYSKYKERQDALRAYCLTCKVLRELAQPVLQRVFRPRRNVDSIVESQPKLLDNVRIFHFSHWALSFDSWEALAKMPKVKEVRLWSTGEDLRHNHQELLTGIDCLVLQHINFVGAGPTFFNLTSLCLNHVCPASDCHVPFLTASALPSLRALYTRSFHRDQLMLLPDVHSQLDFLQVHLADYHGFTADLLTVSPPLLVAFRIGDGYDLFRRLESFRPAHLSLNTLTPYGYPSKVATINIAIASNPELRTISLPVILHPSSLELPSSWIGHRDHLLETCASRKVNVIWRFNSHSEADDFALDREFWACAKEMRRTKEAEEALAKQREVKAGGRVSQAASNRVG
ncbi:hypothetical protein JCM11251_007907 [Rhodosporidiobolus azoricus]